MTHPAINAELMLKAAEMAIPGKEWCRPIIAGHPDYNDGKETLADYVAYFDYDGPEDLEIHFNPLTSDSDAWALERALKKEGWSFGLSGFHENYYSAHKLHNTIYDDSDSVLLLACVSAMTGLPLHAKGVEG